MIHYRGSALRTPTSSESRGISSVLKPYSRTFWYILIRDVAQLVARTAGGGEVAGSSPVIPTRDACKIKTEGR